jgi:hypothetical protein
MIRTICLLLLISICTITSAQDCGGYMIFRKNTTLQYTNSGGMVGTTTYTTSAVVSDSAGCSTTVTYKIPVGKRSLETTWSAVYQNNMLKIPLSSYIPIGVMELDRKKKKDSQPEEEVYIDYPSVMEVDQQFENITTSKTGTAFGRGGVTTRVSIINREVVAKEKVTTPAGSWECSKIKAEYTVKITYDKIDWKTSDMDMKCTMIEWFVPGVGVVKAQTTVMGQTATSTLTSVTSN